MRIALRLICTLAAVALLAYGLFSGALLNPTGFLHRIERLTTSASQDWRTYVAGFEGVAANLRDIGLSQERFFWPWPMVALAWLGVALSLAPRAEGGLEEAVALDGPPASSRHLDRRLPAGKDAGVPDAGKDAGGPSFGRDTLSDRLRKCSDVFAAKLSAVSHQFSADR